MIQQSSQKTRRIGWWLFPILLAGACGCGNTAKVTGKVTYQGRPVVHGSVTFLSADKTARSGVIEADGSYAVEDVPSGTVQIGVTSRDPSRGHTVLQRRPPSPPRQDRGMVPAATEV